MGRKFMVQGIWPCQIAARDIGERQGCKVK